jgi:hypothetical protein
VQTITLKTDELKSNTLSPQAYLDANKARYRRRLVRLFRCHYLPHQICDWLDINIKMYGKDLQDLDSKGVCLSFDKSTESDYKRKTPPSSLTKAEYQNLVEDYDFYRTRCQLKTSEVAKLLHQTRSRLRDLKRPSGNNMEKDIQQRNACIVDLFVKAECKKGLKSSLAHSFQLSRKMIDLILDKAGVEHCVSTPRKKHERPSKALAIIATFQRLQNRTPSLPSSELYRKTAELMQCSDIYVRKVMKRKLKTDITKAATFSQDRA